MEMSKHTEKLKSLKLELGEDLIVRLFFISLPTHFRKKGCKELRLKVLILLRPLRIRKRRTLRMLHKGAKRAKDVLELIHTYICGPFPTASWNGQRYLITFIDDYSRYSYLYLIHEKSQSLDVFKSFKAEVELQFEKKIKVIKSDRGGGYYSRYDGSREQHLGSFALFLKECGIVPQYTMPSKSSMNGVTKRTKFLRIWVSTKIVNKTLMASHQWYHKFHQVIISYDFEENVVDDCIYDKFSGNKYIFSILYVDDILLASSDTGLLHETKRFLTKNFKMKDLGEASFVLGIQILRDRSQGILRLLQESYINKVLERFGTKDSKPGDTLIAKGDKFSLNSGSLMYAQVCTHPDIAFVVGVLGKYLSNLGISSGTLTPILQDVKTTNALHLDTSTCWLEELSFRTPSTIAIEFVACFKASNHGMWLQNFVTSLREVDGIEKPLKIYSDNNIVLYSNNKSSTKSKFIDIKFLVIKERVQNKQISIKHIGTSFMLVSPLTKALIPKVFHEHTTHIEERNEDSRRNYGGLIEEDHKPTTHNY
ncbi:hypothetical protein CR513_60375, partial [Mucuna pruriens]